MKLSNVLFILSLIPSVLSAGHEGYEEHEHSSDAAAEMEHEHSSDDMLETAEELNEIDDDATAKMLNAVAGEVANMNLTSVEEEAVAEIAESVLDVIDALEETATGITSGVDGLVNQVLNEILGTESPTPAPTVFVPEQTNVDMMVGQVQDTVNTIADASGDILNEIFNESPTAGP